MKLRIKGNTIRLRLTKPEVEHFAKQQLIEEITNLFPSTFSYKLQAIDSQTELSASFENNSLTVFMPSKLASQWTESEQVGLEASMKTKNDETIFILVEKDFKCLDETSEDQSDNYDNPLRHNHEQR